MIRLDGVGTRVGGFALSDISATIPAGAWGVVLGPAGSGKTTLLETIAGVRRPSSGRVHLRGEDVTHLAPEGRRIGLVHQHGYLFPHLGVYENVRYGARDASYADEISRRFGADALRSRPVRSLSGGERQVVALARALAADTDILLLDEPLSALDPRRRIRARTELRAVQRERGITMLHVTHDFAEAGMLGDIAMVMEAGRLSQVGDPATVFRRPASPSVADFLGAENVFTGTITRVAASDAATELHFSGGGIRLIGIGDHPGGLGHAVIRGDDITISLREPSPSSARNAIAGTITDVASQGALSHVTIDVGESTLVAVVTRASVDELALAAGMRAVATIKATAVHLC